MTHSPKQHEQSEQHERHNQHNHTLAALWHYATSAVITVDALASVRAATPSVMRCLGYEQAELEGQALLDFVHPDDHDYAAALIARVRQHRRGGQTELRWRLPSGAYKWFDCLVNTSDDALLQDVCVVTFTDIDEHKKNDDTIRKREMQLTESQLVGRIGSWEFDFATNKLMWSDQTYLLMGIAHGKPLTTETYLELIHPDDRPLLLQGINDAFRYGKKYDLELRHTMPDGSVRYHQARGRAKRDINGIVVSLYGTLADIHDFKLKEAALREMQDMLAEAQTIGNVGSWEYDLASDTTLFSEQCCRMMGLPCDKPLRVGREEHTALVHPEDMPLLIELAERSIVARETYESTYRLKSGTGEYRYFYVRGKTVFDEQDRPVKQRGIMHDVHEATLQRKALQESERRFRAIVEQSSELVLIFNLDGTYSYISPSWESILGYTSSDLIGKPFTTLLHPEDVSNIMPIAERIITGSREIVRGLEYRVLNKQGEWRWHRLTGSLVCDDDEDNSPLYFAGMAQDIHERRMYRQRLEEMNTSLEERIAKHTLELKHANTELREQQIRIQALVENTDDTFWSVDMDLRLTAFNSRLAVSMKRNLGIDIELGMSISSIIEHNTQAAQEFWRESYARALTGEKFSIERGDVSERGDLLEQNPSASHVEFSFNPIRNEAGIMQGVVCVARDISERKQAEARIQQALQQERELSELKTRFVSMVSHEFRTPLTTIRSSSELLNRNFEKLTEAKRKRYFGDIEYSVVVMTQLLEDVLFLGKAGANRIQVQPWTTDLVQLCNASVQAAAVQTSYVQELVAHARTTAVEELRERSASRVQITIRPDTYGRSPVIDGRLVRQILVNLISNALKYSDANTVVELSARCSVDALLISVTDHGIGMSAEDLKLLGEPFHRGANAEHKEGTGLGIAIVKQAVELMDGSIWWESTLNVGTTFHVKVPCTYG
jgi:PAS domain S-box-containing protein